MPETEGNLNDTISDAIGLLTRRRWWVLLTAGSVTLATIGVALWLPDRYTSQATLVLTQQQVSKRFVEPNDTTTPVEAIQSITREILSRGSLIEIINELGLYRNELGKLPPEILAERMRDDVGIEPVDAIGRDYRAFRISFTAGSPMVAQAATNRLTSLFIEQNLQNAGKQATSTSKFLAEQLERAKKRLEAQESRVQDFKMRNLGQLPEQEQSNLGMITDLRIQAQTTAASLNRARQQRASFESSINSNIAGIQSEKTLLLERYTPMHPEVVKRDRQIARMQALLDHLRTGTQIGITTDDASIATLLNQVDTNASEIETLTRDQQRLTTEISQYQSHLSSAPLREQQLASIQRDYDLNKQEYLDLLNKQQQAQIITTLEEQQAGQSFRLIDPPTLPIQPSSPKRLKISLGGAGAGLFLGIALAFLMEIRDSSFHIEKNIRENFKAPLVVGVPLMLTPKEQRTAFLIRTLEWVAACLVAMAVFAAEFYVYRHG